MFSSGFGTKAETKKSLRTVRVNCPILCVTALMFFSHTGLQGQALVAASSARSIAEAPGASSVTGTIEDTSEAAIPGATVSLKADLAETCQRVQAGEDGTFRFADVSPGVYRVTVAREGFEDWHGSAVVVAAENLALPEIAMAVSPVSSAVEVRASVHDIAQAQLQLEEKQRVLGVFPNFYASYAPNAEPLSGRQKFQLAWRFSADPVAFAMAGVVAGSEQRANTFSAYGRGASGYMKRYGAAYTDGFTSTFLGQAIFPALLHQDPRYFVKGTGSVGSRALYAIASMVICKGDNRRWQMNYSNVMGNFASAAISNAYYPAANRGAGLVVSNAMTATAMGAAAGLIQEFLLHRMTPHIPDYESLH